MRILLVSKACYVAVYRKKLEELAALPGVDLTLLVPPYWRTGEQRAMLEPGMFNGYRTIVDNPVLNGNFHLHFYRRLRQHLTEIKPDLLHIEEEPYDFVTFHALRCARRAGTRLVFFTWQNIERNFPPPFRWFEHYVLYRSSGAIVGNQAAGEILKHKGYRGHLTFIPQFGVDPEIYCPEDRSSRPKRNGPAAPFVVMKDGPGRSRVPLQEKPFTIGHFGRLVPEKGILVLIDAVANLRGDWHLTILGDGPLRPAIKRLLLEKGLDDRVELRNHVPSTEVPDLLRSMDALVLPSLTTAGWMEQFGRILVEAMACEVAVIGSDSGEIPNVIGDGGLIAREGDATALRHQIQRLIDDPGLHRDLARRGRARVLQHYTQKQIAVETYRFYQQILDEPSAP